MHGKDKIVQELTPTPAPDRSVEAPSADRRIGRHRAADQARQRRSTPGGRVALLASTPVRLALATTVTCGLGLVAFAESRAATAPANPFPASLADRAVAAERQPASRGSARTPLPVPSSAGPVGPSPRPRPTRPTRPAKPKPVAGLTQAQMDNAAVIVQVGLRLRIPRQGLIVAVATAMQESDLYNLASDVLPESKDYPHQGSGSDYDSVGLFQQRTSTGWGAVADLMRPSYAAQRFYQALLEVQDWQRLSVTAAAQSVQASAFPDAYAKHERRATAVVDALS